MKIGRNIQTSKRVLAAFLICLLGIGYLYAYAYAGNDYYQKRASLLAYMLKVHLGIHNFGHKKIDKVMSKNAFGLYLRQLDPQKRFLLQSDVRKLIAYSGRIDDEIRNGSTGLADTGSSILSLRVSQVQGMVKELLSRDFDFDKDETIETDPGKLDYCRNLRELKDRWRRILKYDVVSRYVVLVDDFNKGSSDARKTAREKVTRSYEDLFSRMLKEKKAEPYDRYLRAIARAFDPHTDYLPPASKEAFDVSMKGSFEGIGATLREEDGYIKVESIIPGSPSARQGQLQPGDIILKVAEGVHEPVDIFDMKITEAVRLIRGKKGTEVRLTVKKRDGSQSVIPIVRDTIQIEETFAKAAVIEGGSTGPDFGYIKLPGFYRDFSGGDHGVSGRNATDDIKAEIRSLEARKIRGLILDLRHNGGGFLTDAVNIAGLFIGSGPVVQIKSSDGNLNTLSSKDPSALYQGALVVLVDELSASASEILAGALQDYGRAVIVGGAHTHGKGTVQRMVDLDDYIPFPNMEKFKPLGALSLTIQKFYRVTGQSTQYRGVAPDIILPDRLKCMKIGERYLDFALPWDKVEPISYRKWPQPPNIRTLKRQSEERVRSSRDFMSVLKKGKRTCEELARTTRSLDIAAIRKERSDSGRETERFHMSSKTKDKARDNARQPEGDNKKLWIDEVGKDPYVREAMAVLKDMIMTGNLGKGGFVSGSRAP